MGPLRARITNVPPCPGRKTDVAGAPLSQGGVTETGSQPVVRGASRSPPPPAPTDGDPWSHPEVRELLFENERMLVELAAFQELGSAHARKRLELLVQSEACQRQALEREYWETLCTHMTKANADRARLVVKALQEVVAENEELRGFMMLAQDALEQEDDVARRLSTSSPGNKRPRSEMDSAATPSPGGEDSGKKRSPAHLTHMRKTLQPERLPATVSVKRGDSVKS